MSWVPSRITRKEPELHVCKSHLWHFPLLHEENIKPEKHTKAPENADIDQNNMKMKKRYLEPTCEDDDPHSPSLSRVSDIFTGVDRASYQVREPIENDEDTLAMKRGGMPPPLPQRFANPGIREDQASQ